MKKNEAGESPKNAKNAKAKKNTGSAKANRTSGGVSKMPAGTPKQGLAKDEGYTARDTSDPPVPNRAHTEM